MSTTDTAVPGPPPTQELSRWQYAGKEISDLFRGDQERHRRLHGRLLAILLLSLVLDLVIASALTVVDTASGVGGSFPRALIWTTSQIVAGGSSFAVTSWFGHIAEVFLQVYMVTVIAAVAGSFASYFTSE
jgi:hypothetical protein